jgi:hypothetical protein
VIGRNRRKVIRKIKNLESLKNRLRRMKSAEEDKKWKCIKEEEEKEKK